MRKKVIVLGGSSGIGKAIAERFAKEGWLVMVGAHDLSVNGLKITTSSMITCRLKEPESPKK